MIEKKPIRERIIKSMANAIEKFDGSASLALMADEIIRDNPDIMKLYLEEKND